MENKAFNPVGNLVRVKNEGFNPLNPVHMSTLAQAIKVLWFCGDTMGLVVQTIGKNGSNSHTQVRDAFRPATSRTSLTNRI